MFEDYLDEMEDAHLAYNSNISSLRIMYASDGEDYDMEGVGEIISSIFKKAKEIIIKGLTIIKDKLIALVQAYKAWIKRLRDRDDDKYIRYLISRVEDDYDKIKDLPDHKVVRVYNWRSRINEQEAYLVQFIASVKQLIDLRIELIDNRVSEVFDTVDHMIEYSTSSRRENKQIRKKIENTQDSLAIRGMQGIANNSMSNRGALRQLDDKYIHELANKVNFRDISLYMLTDNCPIGPYNQTIPTGEFLITAKPPRPITLPLSHFADVAFLNSMTSEMSGMVESEVDATIKSCNVTISDIDGIINMMNNLNTKIGKLSSMNNSAVDKIKSVLDEMIISCKEYAKITRGLSNFLPAYQGAMHFRNASLRKIYDTIIRELRNKER